MTDRELLRQLAGFINKRNFIQGEAESICDMVSRYIKPPLTLRNQVAMQMTVSELNQLITLMQKVNKHLQTEEKTADVR